MSGVYAMPGKPIVVKGENAKRLLRKLNPESNKVMSEIESKITASAEVVNAIYDKAIVYHTILGILEEAVNSAIYDYIEKHEIEYMFEEG